MRRPNLEASSSIETMIAFLLVDEQSDVVSIINVREGVLADLDADFTTDMLHNEVHCLAEQGTQFKYREGS